ncbi:outer membrane protein [Bartonella sp. DGB1]|uniref:outer membrane protein n=1 Tax=Bartonella sp. DGB1 TaxID=3239807 RepID=UPI00352591A1
MKNKNLILASVVGLLTLSSVQAADLVQTRMGNSVNPTTPYSSKQDFTWEGFYIGFQKSFAMTKQSGNKIYIYAFKKIEDETPEFFNYVEPIVNGDLSQNFAQAGIYAGYNFLLGNSLVLGLEVDAAYRYKDFGFYVDGAQVKVEDKLHIKKGDFKTRDFVINNGQVKKYDDYLKTSSLDSNLRVRAGLVVGRFLPFVTVGANMIYAEHLENKFNNYNKDFSFKGVESRSSNKVFFGMTAGAGAEVAITNNLILRAEYRYAHTFSTRGEPRVYKLVKDEDNPIKRVDMTVVYEDQSSALLGTHAVNLGISYKF